MLVREHIMNLITERLNDKTAPEKYKDEWLQRIINDHCRSSQESKAKPDDLLDKQELYQMILTMFFAGVDTTSHLMQIMTYILCQRKDIYEKVMKEMNSIIQTQDDITFDNLNKLEYMHAVLRQTLR